MTAEHTGGTRKRHHGPMRRMGAAISEVSGAFGDMGTLLPYVVAALAAGVLAPTPVFLGFAAAYLLVAIVYRLPIAVQPMKALGAIIVIGGLSALEIAWAGAILGAILLAVSLAPRINQVARMIPQTVIVGLQVGLGLTLGMTALRLMAVDWVIAALAASVLALAFIWRRGPWALLVVVAAAALGSATPVNPMMSATAPSEPLSFANIWLLGVLPQLPLTLLNAVVVAAAVSRSIYGERAVLVSERKLAATSGFINLVAAPFGAFPMCHGAGGIAAHHRFGACGIGAPLLLAALCTLAALAGPDVVKLLGNIPAPVTGALLAYAAIDLAFSRRLIDARPDCRPVIAATAFVTVLAGAAPGLLAGLAGEAVRAQIARRNRRPHPLGRRS